MKLETQPEKREEPAQGRSSEARAATGSHKPPEAKHLLPTSPGRLPTFADGQVVAPLRLPVLNVAVDLLAADQLVSLSAPEGQHATDRHACAAFYVEGAPAWWQDGDAGQTWRKTAGKTTMLVNNGAIVQRPEQDGVSLIVKTRLSKPSLLTGSLLSSLC